jgi:SAM-dependent methyltransferase
VSGSPDIGVPEEARLARERQFHDAVARDLSPELLLPQPPGPLEEALLEAAGDLRGRRVLDLGCGSGDLTLMLLERGARVTALDLSPEMVRIARERAELFGRPDDADWVAAAVEASGLPSGAYDLVLGRFILHHLELEPAAAEIVRLLAPQGRAVFLENSARNPVLMLARRHLAGRLGIPRLGTEDEMPLRPSDVGVLSHAFGSVELSYPVFEFLRLFDRQVLRFRWPRLSRAIAAADTEIARLVPLVRPFSFRVLVTATPIRR